MMLASLAEHACSRCGFRTVLYLTMAVLSFCSSQRISGRYDNVAFLLHRTAAKCSFARGRVVFRREIVRTPTSSSQAHVCLNTTV